MKAIQANESFLLTQFRDFYSEVIRLKDFIKSSGIPLQEVAPPEPVAANGNGNGNGNGHAVNAGVTAKLPVIDPGLLDSFSGSEKITSLAIRGTVDPQPEPISEQSKLAQLVWRTLMDLFRRNAVQVMRTTGTPTDNYFEAQYVMAAVADEVFIHLDWEGKRAWTANLLETALFQTHVAGELFFDKLDRLLRDRDPADKSLAMVYLTALSLGFRGKYHGLNDHGKLRRYRQDLVAFAFRQPQDLEGHGKIAFPDCYLKNLRKEKKKKLTNPRVWVAVLALVVVTYLAVSHGIWMSLTSRIERANQRIGEVEKRLDSIPPTAN
jgi:type VI secretion system protein ImpK